MEFIINPVAVRIQEVGVSSPCLDNVLFFLDLRYLPTVSPSSYTLAEQQERRVADEHTRPRLSLYLPFKPQSCHRMGVPP